MSTHRFFINQKLSRNKRLSVTDEALLHQWRAVLRLTPGARIILFDGEGSEAIYEVGSLTKKRADLILQSVTKPVLPKRKVHLAWSLLKRENNELIIQKATELGVSQLIPIMAERCVRSHVSNTRTDRWQRIATEAAEQCGRGDIPLISGAVSPADLINSQPRESLIVCRVGNQHQQNFIGDSGITVLVGPEGGWSPNEERLFDEHEVTSLSLGQFTLRAETAAIIATSKLL
jgi:16S rRNA (uracil1498-N3)-methyltransferase